MEIKMKRYAKLTITKSYKQNNGFTDQVKAIL